MGKGKKVPNILPREPLTKKAKAAILKYTTIQGERKGMFHVLMVEETLKAERMRRADLYTWLEERGYKWRPEVGVWQQK